MTITLYAQPYDISANGFYFSTADDFRNASKKLRNGYRDIVEEFEIQFIDGEDIDCALFDALGIHQGIVRAFLETAIQWAEWVKVNVIIATGEVGYSFDIENDCPEHFDIMIYHVDSLKELAEEFINDGLFGDIPESLTNYIDIEAIARDLSHDYTETVIAGTRIIYRAD